MQNCLRMPHLQRSQQAIQLLYVIQAAFGLPKAYVLGDQTGQGHRGVAVEAGAAQGASRHLQWLPDLAPAHGPLGRTGCAPTACAWMVAWTRQATVRMGTAAGALPHLTLEGRIAEERPSLHVERAIPAKVPPKLSNFAVPSPGDTGGLSYRHAHAMAF